MKKFIFVLISFSSIAFAKNEAPKNSVWVSNNKKAWVVKTPSGKCTAVILESEFPEVGLRVEEIDKKAHLRGGYIFLGKEFIAAKQFDKVLVSIDNGRGIGKGMIVDGDTAMLIMPDSDFKNAKSIAVLLQSTKRNSEIPLNFSFSDFSKIVEIQSSECKVKK